MHDAVKARITRYIADHRKDFAALLCQIISIPSPTGHEEAKAAWIQAYLHKIGEHQAYIDAAGNVVCPYRIKDGETFPLYSAHTDTVFSQLHEITPRIKGNMLSAPSCGDNSAGIAGLLFIMTMLRDLDLSLPNGALFAFNVGEEGLGNLKGMRRLMNDWAGRVSEVIAADCTFDQVVAVPVGSRRYAVSVRTPGGHSWMHFGQVNAIAAAAAIISQLYALTVPAEPKTTYNIGTISGGTTVNTIAACAEFTVDLRSESHDELRRLDESFHALLTQAEGPGVSVCCRLLGERPCSSGTKPDELCRRIAAVRRAHGLDTAFISGSTDANIPLSLGIPAISFGICRSHGEHTVDEWLELDTAATGLMMLTEFMFCCGGEQPAARLDRQDSLQA